MKLVPVPVVKLPPALVLNCQVAPASRPDTFTVPTFVMPSVLLVPLSVAKENPGAAGALVSTVIAAGLLVAAPVLPATSVCLTCTAPLA